MVMILLACIASFVIGLTYANPIFDLAVNQNVNDTYDYVVVGCGISGLVVSMRLTELPDISVLCLEAGTLCVCSSSRRYDTDYSSDNYEDAILAPYFVGRGQVSSYDWQMVTTPQRHLDGNTRSVPAGKGVGGSSLINGMVWNRGNQESFDSWAQLGNRGWTWNDLLPYFRKSESFTATQYPEQSFLSFNNTLDTHGIFGPVKISYPNHFWPQTNNWFEALESIGIPTAANPDEGLSAGGYFLPNDLDPSTQTRSDARRAYYDPWSFRPNLKVLDRSMVTKILFDNTHSLQAAGVEYQDRNNISHIVNARKEVILAAGALRTPQLLELSGIGQSKLLKEHQVDVLEDLPGVGNNLQDHALIHVDYPYTVPNMITSVNIETNKVLDQQCIAEYHRSRTGPCTAKALQAVAFPSLSQMYGFEYVIPNHTVREAMSYLPSNYEGTLRAGYARQAARVITELNHANMPAIEILNNNAGGLDLALQRPLSRGTVHIASKDPLTPPKVDPRWLINPSDLTVMLQGFKVNDRLVHTPSLQQLEPTYSTVPENATLEQLLLVIRRGVGTEYHYAGTAAMMPRELGGVINSSLVVYGTSNLRIVDTSIIPIIPAAHLQAVAYAIAEKAADLIKGVTIGPA